MSECREVEVVVDEHDIIHTHDMHVKDRLYARVNQYRVFLSLGSSAFCGRMSQCWPCLLAEKGDTLYFMVRRTTPVNFDRESKADAERYANSGWQRWRSGTCKLTTRWRRRRPRREAPAAHELSSARSSSGDARRPRLSRLMRRTTEPTPTPARAP